MMDSRNYPPAPASSYPDPLASAAAASSSSSSSSSSSPPATAWAYERGASSLKPSLSYGGGPSSETDLLHRQTYTTSHQLPAYGTATHPAGLSGIFDNTMQSGNSNTKETSVMNFLSAIESRNAQAVSSGTTLLPQFRTPTWQPAMHSSTELFVTGALPASGTFPPASAYQHPSAFSSRSFATTPSLTLQDATFSATPNGLLTAHDPLLQIKTSQGPVPAALTFERLGSSVLSTSVPPQSSTYRSAQESAPHLLQPQFSLLPSSLGGAQQAPQVYSSTLFTGSTASVERALQRECSVIKHHQRPSSAQSVQAQLTDSQHSLHNFLSSASGTDFQDASRPSSLSCSPESDATQVSDGGTQQNTSQVSSVELTQSYTSAVPSPGFPSVSTAKTKLCSTKQPPRSTKTPKPHSVAPTGQTQTYSETTPSQDSVIAGQAQIYSTAQLPSLLSVSQSQNYVSTQSQNVPSISHAQAFSAIKLEKLPPLYKTLAFGGQSQAITSESQTLSYSSDQQVLSSVSSNSYSGQTRDLSSDSQSQNYSSSHSQGLSAASQPVSYSSQSQAMSVSPSETYTTGQALTLSSQSLPFSSSSHVQSLSGSSPPQNYISLHSQVQESSSAQSQKFLPVVQSTPFALHAPSQALQNSRSSSDMKSYIKRKSDPNLYQTSKQEDPFPVQELQVLQQQTSLDSSPQRLNDGEGNAQDATFKVSKADNRYSQSVIRSNSRLEEQVVGLTLQGSKKDEEMVSSLPQLTQQIGHMTNVVSHDLKKAANVLTVTQINMDGKELSQQHSLLHKVHEVKVSEHQDQVVSTAPQLHAQAIRHSHHLCLPSAQVLLEPACDLQMFQQSILQSGLGQTKLPSQVQRIQSSQQMTHQFLQVDGHMMQSNGGHCQPLHLPNSEVMKMDISQPPKPLQQHLVSKENFVHPNHDSKNQFVSLNSVCFPESMLLNDERNILSNVDDILAATAAACGVTPSEFAKSASNEEEMHSVENGANSKSQFQTIDVRHVNPGFSSSPAIVGKPLSLNNISLSGGQITLNLTAVPTQEPENRRLNEQHNGTPDPCLDQRQDQVSGLIMQQLSPRNGSENKNSIHMDGTLNVKDIGLVSSCKTLNEEHAGSSRDFNMQGEHIMTGSKVKVPSHPISMQQLGDENGNRVENESPDLSQEDLQRQKNRGQNQIKNASEDDMTQKQLKRGGQCKRQNSRGTDANLPNSPAPESCHETYQHHEKMRQKIKEVEENQPEVRTGFIASFLDFLKSGPRQQFSIPAVRVPNRVRRPVPLIARATCPHLLSRSQTPAASTSVEGCVQSSDKKGDEEPKRNPEALPSFSSDEDSVGGNQDLQKSITSALSTLDDTSDKKKKSEREKTVCKTTTNSVVKKDFSKSYITVEDTQGKSCLVQHEKESMVTDQIAKIQATVAVDEYVEDDSGDSGGEGMYRERDEFVVKIEDIEPLKTALKTGTEPPAIWKVQKALLQKFVPEVRDGQREFAATNSYLGYFGDAKSKYKRVYVKFIENANKKEYVRVCSKRPRNKPVQPVRTVHCKPSTSISNLPDPPVPKATTTTTTTAPTTATTTKVSSVKPKAKQPKIKAEPPPKKRKTWKEFPTTPQHQSNEEDNGSPAPVAARFLNTRAMKETFRSYMELLVSIALDPDTMLALEKSNDELLLPHMRKIDGMLNDSRKRLLSKLRLERSFKAALESFPELTIITRDSKSKTGVSAVSRIKMNGKAYNKKTLKISKATTKLAQDFAVDPEKIPLCSLYHSLHHYKYHMFLRCKVEISSVQKKNADLGQEEIVQQCMKNIKWVEELFEKFGELLNHVQQKCS